MPHLNMDQRNKALGMLSIGSSKRNIALLMNCNRRTIIDLWNRYEQQGQARGRFRTGRPCVTTAKHDRCMRLAQARDRFLSAAETTRQKVGIRNRLINESTVSRRLAANGLKSRR